MKRYFYLQLKRTARFFPCVLTITVVLVVGLSLILGAMINNYNQKDENQIFNIGITGDMENRLLKLGIEAFKSIDGTRFSLDFVEMSEEQAKDALATGKISAYVVLPDNFIENALNGVVVPIEFVTTVGANDVITMFKTEITRVVTDMVIASQKGTYGIGDALYENGAANIANKHIEKISIEYFDLILKRDKMSQVEELGVSGGLTTTEYYLCSILIVFIMIMGLPFVCLYCKKDNSLPALLMSKGISTFGQLASEYLSHLLSLTALTGTLFGVAAISLTLLKDNLPYTISPVTLVSLFLYFVPVIVLSAAFNIMISELSGDIIGGLLLHFFTTFTMCYISGCFYPIYSFPTAIQRVSAVLPVGVCRDFLSNFFTQNNVFVRLFFVLMYAVLFFAVGLLARRLKTVRHTGG